MGRLSLASRDSQLGPAYLRFCFEVGLTGMVRVVFQRYRSELPKVPDGE